MGYKIGKIYRIYKIDDPTINYIGSTFTTLRQRFMKHKGNANELGSRRKSVICDYLTKYNKDDFKIILLKEYLVYAETQKDTKHLRAYEQLWINKFRLKKNCINKCNPLNIKRFYVANYRIVNKEKLKIYDKNKRDRKSLLEKEKEKEATKKLASRKVECTICKSIVGIYKLNRHQKTKKCISLSKK